MIALMKTIKRIMIESARLSFVKTELIAEIIAAPSSIKIILSLSCAKKTPINERFFFLLISFCPNSCSLKTASFSSSPVSVLLLRIEASFAIEICASFIIFLALSFSYYVSLVFENNISCLRPCLK